VLVIHPEQNSDRAIDLRRIWAKRVPVEVVHVKHLCLNPRRRYTVRTADGTTFYTGRVDPVKSRWTTTVAG
jgi:hypothetical protein